jgi:hypothetical protein
MGNIIKKKMEKLGDNILYEMHNLATIQYQKAHHCSKNKIYTHSSIWPDTR